MQEQREQDANRGLPKDLQKAQEALQLPEVQRMLKELSEYNLGICMPHMHDDETGEFEVLPDGVVQLEDQQRVRFVPESEVDEDRALPVAWVWKSGDGGKEPVAVCVKVCYSYTEHDEMGNPYTAHRVEHEIEYE